MRRPAAVDDRALAEDQRQFMRERDGVMRERGGKGDLGTGMGIGIEDRRAQAAVALLCRLPMLRHSDDAALSASFLSRRK